MMSRQSIYPASATNHGTSSQLFNSLAACVASVELAAQTLESSVDTITQTTEDFPRFSKALTSRRHFDLVTEGEIRSARDHLSAEIAPQLKELILRAEDALQKDERNAKTLKSKVSQHTARLDQLANLHSVPAHMLKPGSSADASRPNDKSLAAKAQASQKLKVDASRMSKRVQELQRKKEELYREITNMEADVKKEESEVKMLSGTASTRTRMAR